MSTSFFKSIWAVIAGFIITVLLFKGMDSLWPALGPFPGQTATSYPMWIVIFGVVYRIGFELVGGYITASLAPSRPMRHVVIVGIIWILIGIVIIVGDWNSGPSWYDILMTVLVFPALWLGGKWKLRNQSRDHSFGPNA